MSIKLLIVQTETKNLSAAGSVSECIEANINNIKTLLETAARKNNISCADLIVLPEMWASGWDCPNFNKFSEELYSSKTYKFLKELSIKYNSNIIGGSAVLTRAEKASERNTCLIFGRAGNYIGAYDKYHLFSHRGQSEGKYLCPGETGILANLDIGKAAVSICYDIRFPELFRKYTYQGADFIVNMAAWPLSLYSEYETLLHARAVENQIYCISSCLTGCIDENYSFSGGSQVCDYRGRVIAKLAREEKALYTEINIGEMKEYRQQMPVLKDTKTEYKITEI